MYRVTVMLSCVGLGRGLLSLGLVLVLSSSCLWPCLGLGLVLVLSWSCLGLDLV